MKSLILIACIAGYCLGALFTYTYKEPCQPCKPCRELYFMTSDGDTVTIKKETFQYVSPDGDFSIYLEHTIKPLN